MRLPNLRSGRRQSRGRQAMVPAVPLRRGAASASAAPSSSGTSVGTGAATAPARHAGRKFHASPISTKRWKWCASLIPRASPAATCANACSASCATTGAVAAAPQRQVPLTEQVVNDAIAVVDQHLQAVTLKQFKEIARAIGRPGRSGASRARIRPHARSPARPAIQQEFRRA